MKGHDLLGLIRGKIEPVRVPPVYWLGLALTAGAMALLPLLYLGVIASTLAGLRWYAINGIGILSIRPSQGAVILYFGPLAGGLIMVFFMIKPLFAPRRRMATGIPVDRSQEPKLFGYVTRLCRAVGAPPPREIRVDCQVNASASLTPGWASLWRDDLTLTLGLPLVAGCTVRQCSGVLAHEFGHFTQGAGMRLTYWIRAINAWFQRVVFERDLWDARLEALSKQRLGLVVAVSHLALLFVWITRQILRGLMTLGHLISCFMLRQMEFDADKHEARLAGSETFESTTRRIAELTVGLQMTYSDLNLFWEEGRLADDLPRLTAINVERMEAPLRQLLEESANESRGGWFDTHPTDAQRIAAARAERSPGVLAGDERLSDAPAAILFSDFQDLCQRVTLDYYEQALGQTVPSESLRCVEELLGKKAIERDFEAARQRYFSTLWGSDQPLPSLAEPPAGTREEAVSQLREVRQQLAREFHQYRKAFEGFAEGSRLRVAGGQDAAPPTAYSLSRFEDLLAKRLSLALHLFRSSGSAGEEAQRELDRLLPPARMVNQILPASREFRKTFKRLNDALMAVAQKPNSEELARRLAACMRSVHQELRSLRGLLDDTRFPFEHLEKNLSLRDYLAPVVLDGDDLGALLETSRQFLDRTARLHGRLLGRLALLAERGEEEAGLPAIDLK